jgi:methanethiol S-methyltransferase
MISLTVNGFIKSKPGKYLKFYRLFYNLVAFITLVPLIIYTQSLKGNVLFRWEGYLMFAQFFLLTVSMILFIAGAQKYDLLEFAGIRQIISGKSYSTLSESGEIITSGILGVIRHPWYSGSIIFVWVYYKDMYLSTFIVSIMLTFYLITGAVLEERKLILECGDGYRDYIKKVSMFFPFKWILLKMNK